MGGGRKDGGKKVKTLLMSLAIDLDILCIYSSNCIQHLFNSTPGQWAYVGKMPPNPRPAYRGANATSTGPVTPTPGLVAVSTSTPVMASASAQPATPTTLAPPHSSQVDLQAIEVINNAMDVDSPLPTTPGKTSFLDKINRIAPLPCQAIVDASQSAAPLIMVPAHISPISVPSPRPPQEEPQSVSPPAFVPSHISPASMPCPPPSKEASQSTAPLQMPQEQSLPKSEEDTIEHMVSANPHLIWEDTPEPEEGAEGSGPPPTRRKMLIERQIAPLLVAM
ncbi:hypothetical protein EI94DRAFT_1699749 [Lactarius quietus]|nr:hypothetical protein EI94DRAFT_1699749 [Lactarius quietus]